MADTDTWAPDPGRMANSFLEKFSKPEVMDIHRGIGEKFEGDTSLDDFTSRVGGAS